MRIRFTEGMKSYTLVVPRLSAKEKKKLFNVFLSDFEDHLYFKIRNIRSVDDIIPYTLSPIISFDENLITSLHKYDFHSMYVHNEFWFRSTWNNDFCDRHIGRRTIIYSPIMVIMPEIYHFLRNYLINDEPLMWKIQRAAGMKQLEKEYSDVYDNILNSEINKKNKYILSEFKKLEKISINARKELFSGYEKYWKIILEQLVVFCGIFGRIYSDIELVTAVEALLKDYIASQDYSSTKLVILMNNIRKASHMFYPEFARHVEFVLSKVSREVLEHSYGINDEAYKRLRILYIDWRRYEDEYNDISQKLFEYDRKIKKLYSKKGNIAEEQSKLLYPDVLDITMKLITIIESRGSEIESS